MAKLSVNINKIATLRNARGENNPDLIKTALLIESLGADGITVHPRPDQRHIRISDVYELKKYIKTELNIEGYPSKDFISLCQAVRPAQITLVPDPPEVITSNAGFKLSNDFEPLQQAIRQLKTSGARISIFIDPIDFINRDINIIKNTGADRIELYTQAFACEPNNPVVLEPYIKLARGVRDLGMQVNAGHDLSLDNLGLLLKAIPWVSEVSIGHALICDALLLGLPETMRCYVELAHGSDY